VDYIPHKPIFVIKRTLADQLTKRLDDPKALIVLGPRQVGKTTLIRALMTPHQSETVWWNGDDADIRSSLHKTTAARLKHLVGNHRYLVIDEAQRIENIGLCIKLIIDNLPDVKVIATGSSSFDLANKINEPLTGRKREYHLMPLSFGEMVNHAGLLEERRTIEHRLLYGYYPEVVTQRGQEQEILRELSSSYLYKDILTWEEIRKPDQLEKLVQAIAFQIGQQVSNRDLAETCGLDAKTVTRYINVLEKSFIVFSLDSFSRNLRNELKKSRKIYFYDLGIRNAVIKNFQSISLRDDVGALWENFMIVERFKWLENNRKNVNRYFWRTTQQQEIDYIEEREGLLHAYEFKWSGKGKKQPTLTFRKAYPKSEFKFVHRENFEDMLVPLKKL